MPSLCSTCAVALRFASLSLVKNIYPFILNYTICHAEFISASYKVYAQAYQREQKITLGLFSSYFSMTKHNKTCHPEFNPVTLNLILSPWTCFRVLSSIRCWTRFIMTKHNKTCHPEFNPVTLNLFQGLIKY